MLLAPLSALFSLFVCLFAKKSCQISLLRDMQTQISSTDHFVYTLGFLWDYEYGAVLSAVLFKFCTVSSCEIPWLGVEIADISNTLSALSERDCVRSKMSIGYHRVWSQTLDPAIGEGPISSKNFGLSRDRQDRQFFNSNLSVVTRQLSGRESGKLGLDTDLTRTK